MKKTIKIESITPMAMTEDDGLKLRTQMENALQQGEEVVLDFEGIDLFSTPFFNSSIGYFVLKLTPARYKDVIDIINLTDLGKETYGHSYQNAISVYENNLDPEMVGRITKQTIDEQ